MHHWLSGTRSRIFGARLSNTCHAIWWRIGRTLFTSSELCHYDSWRRRSYKIVRGRNNSARTPHQKCSRALARCLVAQILQRESGLYLGVVVDSGWYRNLAGNRFVFVKRLSQMFFLFFKNSTLFVRGRGRQIKKYEYYETNRAYKVVIVRCNSQIVAFILFYVKHLSFIRNRCFLLFLYVSVLVCLLLLLLLSGAICR